MKWPQRREIRARRESDDVVRAYVERKRRCARVAVAWAVVAMWEPSGARAAPTPEEETQVENGCARARARIALFASRLDDRIRVGISDPDREVDAIDARLYTPRGVVDLTRLESGPVDRIDFALAPSTEASEVVVEATSRRFGEACVLGRVVLAASEPDRNVVPRAPERAVTTPVTDETSVVEWDDRTLPWWWIVAATLAAGFVGAAVWNETSRDR